MTLHLGVRAHSLQSCSDEENIIRERTYLALDRHTGRPRSGWQIRSAVAISEAWLATLVNRGLATMPFPVPVGTPAVRNAAILEFVQEDKVEEAIAILDEIIRDEIAFMNLNLSAPLKRAEIQDIWALAKGEVPADVH